MEEVISLSTLVEESRKHVEDKFYEEKFYFSYSSLSKLMWNPTVFYALYVLGQKQEVITKSLVEGKVIHALVLGPSEFDKEFVVSPMNLPTENVRGVIDRSIEILATMRHKFSDPDKLELKDFHVQILQAMRDTNFFQALVDDKRANAEGNKLTGDEKRLAKILTPEGLNYWNFAKSRGNRTLIDQQTYSYCNRAASLLITDEKISDLLGIGQQAPGTEVFNEIELRADTSRYPFGLKGILDNLVVDHVNKLIRINDLKTTSKDLKDFPESIEYYSYWLQAAIYTIIISLVYGELIDQGYNVEFHFIVIDQSYQYYAFPVSQATMEEWIDRTAEALKKAEYHYTERKYSLPYAFCKGEVIL